MAFNIGINVIETDGNATPAIEGAPTSVAGLLVRTRRGPTERAVRVSSFGQFAAVFGGHDPRFLGAYGVDAFFRNGGREVHIARVPGSGTPAAASITLKGRDSTNSLKVTAGARGTAEVGAWGNDLYVDVTDNPEFSTRLVATRAGNQPARLTGQVISGTVDLRPANAGDPARVLTIEVDGTANPVAVTLDATTLPAVDKATPADVAAAINAKAPTRLIASVASNGIVLVSRSKGGTASIKAVNTGSDATTRTNLGFPNGNVEATGTAAASTPAYTEAQVTSIVGFRSGDVVRFDDGITQTWVKLTGVERRLDSGGNPQYFVVFTAPTAATDRHEYRTQDAATVSTCEFNLVVRQQTPDADRPVVVETWEKLGLDPARPNYAVTRVNDPSAGSAFVVLADEAAGSYTGRDVPSVIGVHLGTSDTSNTGLTRTEGSDGGDPATADYTASLARFDSVAVQLVALLEGLPDGMLKAVTRAGLDYCAGEDKGDCMWVGHTPVNIDQPAAKAFGQEFRAA
jgi:hypothetical protein